MRNATAVCRRSGMLVLAVLATFSAPGQSQAPPEPPMSAEQKAQMEAWMKVMTPGKPHQEMATKVGVWEGTVSMWDAPGAPPQVNQARAERTMGLGGRVLIDHWKGTMMGMPFEGMGMSGYDNANGKSWSTWSDSFTTGLMTSSGKCDPDPKKGCDFSGNYVDSRTGKDKQNRSTVSWPSADEERMEMFEIGADGKEWKNMEIVIRRAKK